MTASPLPFTVSAASPASICTPPVSSSKASAVVVAHAADDGGECAKSPGSECGVVAVDHAAFLVHFLRESKSAKTVGEGWELIKAVKRHLSVDISGFISYADHVTAACLTQRTFERGFNRGYDFAVIAMCGLVWNEGGGLDHHALSPAHRQVFRYIALYLRKLSEPSSPVAA